MAGHMNAKVQAAENIIGYTFNDPLILWEALNAAGSNVMHAGGRVFLDGNKRLALVGDSILKFALLDDWYPSGQTRGHGQNIVNARAGNTNLTAVGLQNGLGVTINTNPSQGGQISPAVMATTVEAIIGAVHADSLDLNTVKQVMARMGV